ncbi:hypothetical protein CGZ94_04885 [Enemella evansiae]|uniref:Helix-turn-helix domain-containing protein n=1 Tax=Enemella evansiae TaxID=2016499 RepID=A0A255GKA6_9ACTN|nr:hypothetical protein CGZ94_04885 [Enemella evansiae]
MSTAVRPGSLVPLQKAALRTDARILAGRGWSVAAIASRLGVSPSTVSRWLM